MKHLLLIVLFFSCKDSFAGRVYGKVSDKEGKVLPYASVYIKENKKGTNSNIEGNYSLSLQSGTYTLVCQYVGYTKDEKTIIVTDEELQINFQLSLQELTLSEVIVQNREDPAYEIIRQTIKRRKYNLDNPDKFQCEVYTKGQLRLRDYPKKILGQKVDFEDGDTSKRKIIYLAETISRYAADKPDKEKIEVISSKVSGQSDGYGLAAPQIISFYQNSIIIGNSLNPRGFISPLSDNALNYYRYKLEGSFEENGKTISRIKVIPKRKFEPLFSGNINIVEEEWVIYSIDLLLTKQSQMEQLDTLRIVQLYRPVDPENWFIASQVIYPTIKILGFDAYGSFINIYSEVDSKPGFSKKSFNNTLLKYTDSANKKTSEYWRRVRPVPLLEDEQKDFKKKDSLEQVRKDPRYLDSISRARNKINLMKVLVFGQSFQSERKRTVLEFSSMIDMINFNPAEGLVIDPSVTWTKRLDSGLLSRRSISITPVIRYGFSNKHLNSYVTLRYLFGNKHAGSVSISGGKRVFQFNNNSPIGERGNTISCLLSEENRIKSYEAWYLRGSLRQEFGSGFSWVAGFQYQDRMPLNNTTNYTWKNKNNREYTPNYPFEILSENIKRHQAFTLLMGMRWQPGVKYIEFPGRKISIGSKYPVLSLQYIHGIDGFLGSDASFSKWKFNLSDDISLKLRGHLRYRIGIGGFLDISKVEIPDYNHFNGNISTLANEYLNSFQLLPIYQFSNTDKFYTQAHVEYNLKGFLTNKIPGFRKLNFYLVTGANAFYIRGDKNYFEWFVGLDNILKQVRVDYVQSYHNGKPWMHEIRIGLSKLRGNRGDDWP